MTIFDKLEEKRIEIERIKKVISYKKENKNDNTKDDKEKLIKEIAGFKSFVSHIIEENKEELIRWTDFHKKIITRIEKFSDFLNLNRKYTFERHYNIKSIKSKWENFMFFKELPDTFLIEDYALFYDLNEPNDFSGRLKVYHKNEISELEKIRQNIAVLSRQMFEADAITDKGGIWGASLETINKAEKEMKIVRAELNKKNTMLTSSIKKYLNEKPAIITEWQKLHLYTCISVIDFAYTAKANRIQKDSTRLFVANETFYLWKNIFTSEKMFVIPNVYYLRDYNNFFNEILNAVII